jgi:hypothetical protein
MALSEQQKKQLAEQLAEKRRVMGDTAFQSYLGKVEQAIPQRQQEKLDTITEETASVKKLGGVTGFLSRITGTEGLGRGIAASLNAPAEAKRRDSMLAENEQTQNDLLAGLRDARSRGDTKAVANLERELQRFSNESGARMQGMSERADLGVSNRDVIGSAIRTIGTIASAGTYGAGAGATGRLSAVAAPKLTSATTIGRGMLQGLGTGIKTGATSGAIFGGVSGTASGIEQGKGVLGTAFEAVKQGAMGGLVGGAVGGVVGSIGGGFQARTNRKEELSQLLTGADNVDDALSKTTAKAADAADDILPSKPTQVTNSVTPTPFKDKATAGFTTKNGKVVADKKAQALLKQGIEDTDVAIMQSFSPDDIAAAKKMVPIAKETARTGIPNQRQQEIVGQGFMKRAKDVETLNRTAGGQIDDIARTQLAGKPVNASKATDQFFNQLERDGVDIDALRLASTKEEIAQAFEGSSFEGLDTVQRTLKTVLKRVDPDLAGAKMDGLTLHRAKRFIDNQVTYGKNAEGLVGDAERLLKSLRTSIDDVLDTTFPEYNLANTQYKDTIEALDEMRRLIGRDLLGSGDITNLRAGEVMDRLLGKASARPMSALQNLENVSRKYGNSYSDNILKQIRFADLLDDIYETVPKGSLQGRVAGGVAQGIDQGTGFLNRMRQSGFISAALDEGADVLKGAANITPEARQKAVEEFLGLSVK